MKRASRFLPLLLLLGACSSKVRYPEARSSDHVDTYHGVEVADPYRWLEDPDSPETGRWVRDQNILTQSYLKRIPSRDEIRGRLEKLWNYEKYGVPFSRGGRYFYTRNDGLQNQFVLYTADSLEGEAAVLVDPNTMSKDGTVSTSRYTATRDGRFLAYSIQRAGSDWREWRIRSIASRRDLPDQLSWSKFSPAAWLPDGSGFFYGRYPEPEGGKHQAENVDYKLYFHKRGTLQSKDELVYERTDHPKWGFWPWVSEDGRYLVIQVWQGSQREAAIYYKDLREGGAFVEMLPHFDAEYEFLGNEGSKFWFKTNNDAPNGRIVAIDSANPDPAAWKELIPEAKQTIDEVTVVGERFLVSYLEDAASKVKIFQLDGTPDGEIELPQKGTAMRFSGRRTDTETFYLFTSFTYPWTVFRYDFETKKSEVFRRPSVDFEPDDYVVRQVFFRSKDSTKIPMFITHKKGLKLDGSNPTLLHGYGGFNSSITPTFRLSSLVWMELGGIYAVPNLRGGGEYGETWHKAGTRENKQNVFDDFIGAAEYLIDSGYTSNRSLAISGGSNGGLLVGACMTQRPELFGACLPAVGVMDMLRFHKFTIGWAWVAEYGSSDDPAEFRWLRAYSPLHNIRPGTSYPATLVTTADHDDRVVPAHSYKFTAALQFAQRSKNPILIRIETKAGHGAGVPTSKRIEAVADRLAFLVRTLRVKVPASFGE